MSSHVPTYPHWFGLALEHRLAGEPSGNKTLDPVRNRRCAIKNGRRVLAKPRPRGFYYGKDGRVILKISRPFDLQASTLMVHNVADEDEVLLHSLTAMSQRTVSSNPGSELRSNRIASKTRMGFLATDPNSGSRAVRPRDSLEVFSSRGPASKRARPVKHRSTVRLTLNDSSGKTKIVTPRGYEFPGDASKTAMSGSTAERGSKRDSQIWNGYFSPDGTVRTSVTINDMPSLPRSAYTDSENEFADDFTLPKTIYLGKGAYYCTESEYFLPGTIGDVKHLRSVENSSSLQSQPIKASNNPEVHSVSEGYDPALGYLSIATGLHSSEALVEGPNMHDTIHSMDIYIGIDPKDVPTPYEEVNTLQDSKPSPPSPSSQLFSVPPLTIDHRLSWPSIYTVSSVDSSVTSSGSADEPPSPMETVSPLHSPVGVAVLNRAKSHFQRRPSAKESLQK